MSPALSDLPVRKVIRALESVGFSYVRTRGSHAVYRNPEGRAVVVPQALRRKRLQARGLGLRGQGRRIRFMAVAPLVSAGRIS